MTNKKAGRTFLEPPLVHTLAEVGHNLGIGQTKLYDLILRGELRAVKIGSRTMVRRDSVVSYLERQPDYTALAPQKHGRGGKR